MNERNFYYIGIAFFGMINGIFNPAFFFVFQLSAYLMAEPLFGSTGAIAYFASMMVSTATIILGGIPAALYERFSSRGEADFADKLLSAMRYQFGGHIEKKS